MAIYSLRALVSGINRPIEDSDSGRLNSIRIGTSVSNSELTKTILDKLILVQAAADVDGTFDSQYSGISHDHDGSYFTETELSSITDGASGADIIGATAVGAGSATTVQGILEEIESAVQAGTDDQTASEVSYTQAVTSDWTAAQDSSVKVVLDELGAARTVNESAISSNTSHANGDGSDHADVASNTTHRGLTNNPHSVVLSDVVAGTLVANVDIASDAAIALSKLASLTTDRALVSNGSGVISVSDVTSTEIGYLDGVTSGIQTQINALTSGYSRRTKVLDYIVDNTADPTGNETNGNRYILSHDGGAPHTNYDGASAGDIVEFVTDTWVATTPLEGWIAYDDDSNNDFLFVDDGTGQWEERAAQSKALTDSSVWIGNASNNAAEQSISGDISLSNSGVVAISSDVIVNADIKSDAAIAYSKLAALADGYLLIGNGSNVATGVVQSGDVLFSNTGVAAIQSGVIVNDDVNASAAIIESKLSLDYATATLNTTISNHINNTSNPHSVALADVVAGSLVANVDIASDAAIMTTKLADASELAEAVTFFGITGLTGTEAETLSDGSNADSLHRHKKQFMSFTNNTGSALAVGDIVALSTTAAGEIIAADASAIATCEIIAGVVSETIANTASGLVQISGEAIVGQAAAFDLGKRVYLSETAKQGTKTAPATADSVIYLLGGATATNKVLLQPMLVAVN